MATQEKTLVTCTLKYLAKTFKIKQVRNLPALDAWLAQTTEVSELEQQMLLRFQHVLEFNVHDWNEYELGTHFIGPMFSLVDFLTSEFNHFGQREVSAVVDDILLAVWSGGWHGSQWPTGAGTAIFCVPRVQKKLDPNGDPAGQCLAAMLVGQTLNLHTFPIYGCHAVGDSWRLYDS